MISRRHARDARRAIVVGALAAALPAYASPRSDPTDGRAVFTGAATPTPAAIALNPAALGVGLFDELYVATTAVLEDFGVDTHTLDVNTGAQGKGPSVHDYEASPGAQIAGVFHLGKSTVLAADFHSPPGEVFPNGQNALGYSTLGGGQRDYYVTAAFSFKLTDGIFFGGSFELERNQLVLHYLRDTALANGTGAGGINSSCGASPCGVGNPAAADRYDIDVRTPLSIGNFTGELAASFGGLVEIAHDVWLGAEFHFPPGSAVQTSLVGKATVTRAPRDGGASVDGEATVDYSQPASVDAELRARLFADYELHVGGRWEDLSRLTAYDVRTYGPQFVTAALPEWMNRAVGLHDSFAMWAGLEQADAGEAWRFGARIGYETSAVDDNQTSPLTMAGTQYTLDLGARWRPVPDVLLELSYGFSYFPTVSVTQSAFDPRSELNCLASGTNYATPGCADVRNGYAQPTADGDYHHLEHAMRLGLRYEF